LEKTGTGPAASWTALEGTRLAYERTLMAWIRTAVSLISFGFTIYKFFDFFQESKGGQVARNITPRAVGLFMIAAGLFALLMATFEHWRDRRRLRTQYPGMPMSVALVLSAVISALGVLALVAALLRQ
jgi:putative membrane protein